MRMSMSLKQWPSSEPLHSSAKTTPKPSIVEQVMQTYDLQDVLDRYTFQKPTKRFTLAIAASPSVQPLRERERETEPERGGRREIVWELRCSVCACTCGCKRSVADNK